MSGAEQLADLFGRYARAKGDWTLQNELWAKMLDAHEAHVAEKAAAAVRRLKGTDK